METRGKTLPFDGNPVDELKGTIKSIVKSQSCTEVASC